MALTEPRTTGKPVFRPASRAASGCHSSYGPENIRVDAPVPTSQTYSVGVNYYEGATTAPANATVRIYCGDVLRGTYTRRLTGGTALATTNDFWRVARVVFSDPSNCAVTVVDDVISTQRAITTP